MRIIVTGASGRLARVLLPLLCANNSFEQVIGVDITPCKFIHDKYDFVFGDIRDDATHALLSSVDALVHLAFRLVPGRNGLTSMYECNVGGTLSLLSAAHEYGVKNIINLSSVSVYGTGTNLLESAPLNPSCHFPYAEHKTAIEREIISHHQSVTTLRVHYIVGQHAYPFLANLAKSYIYIPYSFSPPIWQIVHEQDVVSAIILFLNKPTSGVYNVAANSTFPLDQLFRKNAGLQIPIPMNVIKSAWKACTLLHPSAKEGWIESAIQLMDTTLTVNCDRLLELGWKPQFTGRELSNTLFE